jgi:hypothetical protein
LSKDCTLIANGDMENFEEIRFTYERCPATRLNGNFTC